MEFDELQDGVAQLFEGHVVAPSLCELR